MVVIAGKELSCYPQLVNTINANGVQMADTVRRVTNLELPADLAEEIDALASADMRKPKPEIVVLLREAVAARGRPARPPMPSAN